MPPYSRPSNYRAPESRGMDWRVAEEYGKVRQEYSPLNKQNPSSIRPPSQITSSPSYIQSKLSQPSSINPKARNTPSLNSNREGEKKLPIFYGVPSPRNEKTMAVTP